MGYPEVADPQGCLPRFVASIVLPLTTVLGLLMCLWNELDLRLAGLGECKRSRGRPRIRRVENFAMLVVEEMPYERLFQAVVDVSRVSSFSSQAVPNLILF